MAKVSKEDLKNVISGLCDAFKDEFPDDITFYKQEIKDYKSILELFFENYISKVEGRSCSVDKAHFIVNKVILAVCSNDNFKLAYSYKDYKENGGNLGGINETNTDLNEICYWCPKVLKDTNQAIELFYRYITLDSKYFDDHMDKENGVNEEVNQ